MGTSLASEILLDLANTVKRSNGIVILEGAAWNFGDVVALALRLQANPALALRAQVEGWNKFQIVRELW